jgi:hypothetical protein
MQKILFLLVLIPFLVQAQYNQQFVLSSQSGQQLIDNLIDQFKPSVVLDYDHARDTMFSKVYLVQDSVSCVYTGRTIYVNPSLDPSTVLHSGGIGLGINTEHTYPQSKGASYGNARSDMHHLFPVRASANSARNNFPYAEIEDSETNTWYYDIYSEQSPTFLMQDYSELDIQAPAFEPREDHKGNAARAVFYFYTMYKQQADAADPSFFAKQVPSLCKWHMDDPVDSLEWERNFIIASYQEGKSNPFVLDCSLPFRTYCPHIPHNSCFTSMNSLADFGVELYHNYPVPASDYTVFSYETDRDVKVEMNIYNSTGVLIKNICNTIQTPGFHQHVLNCSDLPAGLYSYKLSVSDAKDILNIVKQFSVVH